MQQEPMTSKDYDNLTQSLNDMKLVHRPKILVAIEEARQLGDLKENAEYHAAKEDQANINKRIVCLIIKLNNFSVLFITSSDRAIKSSNS